MDRMTSQYPCSGAARKSAGLAVILVLPFIARKHTKTSEQTGEQLVSLLSPCCLPQHQNTQKQISMNLPLLLYSQGTDSSLLFGRYPVLLFGPEVVGDKMALRPAYSTTAREPLVSMLSLNSNHTRADEEMNHDRVTVAHEAYPEHPSR